MAAGATATATAAKKTPGKSKGETKVKKAAAEVVASLSFNNFGGKKANGDFYPAMSVKLVHESQPVSKGGIQPRDDIGEVDELESAIKRAGLIHPIIVRPLKGKEGHCEVVAGARRFKAVKNLDWDTVPVLVRNDLEDDAKARIVAGAENGGPESRKELSKEEAGHFFLQVKKDNEWSDKQVGAHLGVNYRDVGRCIEFVSDVPEPLRKQVAGGTLGFTTALALAKVPEDIRDDVFAEVKKSAGEGGDEEGGVPTISRDRLKQIVKAVLKANKDAAAESGDETGESADEGKGKKGTKGSGKKAAGAAWKTPTLITGLLRELCHSFVTEKDEKVIGGPLWHETRGAIASLLWMRGDVNYPILPNVDPDEEENPTQARKELKKIAALMKTFADEYTPEGEEAGEEAAEATAAA